MWYLHDWSKVPEGNFDTKPAGVLPLNGAVLTMHPEDRSDRTLEVQHPDIEHAHFLMRFESAAIANDWLFCLKDMQKATWDNAQLGFALLEKLKNEGEEKELEKNEALQALQDKAQRLRIEQEDRERVLKRQQQTRQKYEEKLNEEQERMRKLEREALEAEVQFEESTARHKRTHEDRLALERKLIKIEAILKKLEGSLNTDAFAGL